MYRAPSKRRQLIKRIGVYTAMTIGVVILVAFLVLIMLGYRFNRDTSSIQQGGLVQFASRPIDSNVTIGNAKLTDLTPSKITVNPGNYNVTMSKSGYHNWAKNVDVRAGEVLWLNYSQLVPTSIKTDQLTKFDNVADVKSSPSGDRFALITDNTKPVLAFVDVTESAPKQTTMTIPAEHLPAGKTPTFTIGEWANDSDRLLVTMSYDSTVQRLLVDRRDADRTVNISSAYEADIAQILFDPRSSERLIIRTSKGDIRTIDTTNNSLSGVLATAVTDISLYANDALLLVQTLPEGGQSVGYLSLGSNDVRVLKRIESSEKTQIAISKYFSDPYIAISTGSQLDVFKSQALPSSESDASISMTNIHSAALPAAVEYLSIRSGGRFVVAQYASGVQNYDVELHKQTLTNFKSPVASELRWLDRYHFYLTNGTDLEVMEFDGNNAHKITSLTTGFDAVQSENGTFIYTINKTADGKFAVQRSRMILE